MNSPCVLGHSINCAHKNFCYSNKVTKELVKMCNNFCSYADYVQQHFTKTIKEVNN